ncbi:ATP-binding cassette domain-containing protein, partial [Cupriavidus sp. SIMBA_020]|uniref:ATP-binding cassette domain-containing protein n=1 Tax=Cupriavidus sp. SIMBA_020 TaxID=3085766 RepID=UPI003979C485
AAATPEQPVLEVKDLRKTYVVGHGWLGGKREVHAVDGVSFSVRRGETLGIVGESGSGKSTIGKCLLKLVGINGGQLIFNGQDIAAMPLIAMVPVLAGGDHHTSSAEDLRHGLQVLGSIAVVVVGGRYLLRPVFRIVA